MQPFKKNKLRAPALPSLTPHPACWVMCWPLTWSRASTPPLPSPSLIQPPAGLVHICHWQGTHALVGTVTRASLPRPRLTTAEPHRQQVTFPTPGRRPLSRALHTLCYSPGSSYFPIHSSHLSSKATSSLKHSQTSLWMVLVISKSQFHFQSENLNLGPVLCLPCDECEGKHTLGHRIS